MRVKRRKSTLAEGLSELEAEIMKTAWREEKTTVRDVHEVLLEQGYIPYTSVMAIMNGLVSKGLLRQDKSARTYTYKPVIDREQLAYTIVDAVVDRILEGDTKVIIDYLRNGSNV
ncbi:MAG: BlaI/MecI/CopY family transcriptional regulator [Candidatus Aquicultorales bacterium]